MSGRSPSVSGESWDNVIYLPRVDRMAVIGVSREGITFRRPDGTATGPYFWDPARADAARSRLMKNMSCVRRPVARYGSARQIHERLA